MDFDGAGDLISPGLPNFPVHLAARPLAGGKLRVSWVYVSVGEGAAPADFQVFAGVDGAAVDYNTPLVDSITGLNHTVATSTEKHSFTTAAYADGASVVFGVRGRNSFGVSEKNTRVSAAVKARASAASATSILLGAQR